MQRFNLKSQGETMVTVVSKTCHNLKGKRRFMQLIDIKGIGKLQANKSFIQELEQQEKFPI